MKISVLNPDVYSNDKLYGSADSGVMNPEISTNKDVKISSITSSVLSIALEGFEILKKSQSSLIMFIFIDNINANEEEKHIEVSSDESKDDEPEVIKPKLLKTLLFECGKISPLWSDCLVDFIKQSNCVNDLFSPV